MADSTTNLDLLAPAQLSPDVTANALFDPSSPATLFGRRALTTAALTWGMYGGKYRKADGTISTITNGTVSLTASATNYVKETDGTLSVTTSAPSGWPGPLAGGAKALYEIVCDGSGPTSYTDYRTNGIGSGNGSGSVTSVGLSVPAFLSVSGSPVTGAGTLAVTYSGTALPVANGGTGATSASAARTSLGLAIGTDVQAYSAKLADIAGLTYAQGDILYYNGTNVVNLGAGTSGQFLKTQGTGANPVWASATGATLADGDYGDITVSSSGTVMSIDNNTVTYAKMQDVSATSRVLGRKTAGAGDPEELTLSDILDFIGSAAQGDLLYRGASGWARLGAGTSGQYLQTQGASANPVWATASSGGTPGGSNTQVQFNDGGAFGGDADLTWDKTNNILKIGASATPGKITTPDAVNGGPKAGDLSIRTGAGQGLGASQPGDITIQPGDSGGTGAGTVYIKGCSGSNIGDVYVQGGAAIGGTQTGGTVYVQGGAATVTGAVGGSVSIKGADGLNNGGSVTVAAGSGKGVAGSGGQPGTVSITGGAAVLSAAGWNGWQGGAVTVTGGAGGPASSGATSGAGGPVNINGGAAGSGTGNANGGDVVMTPGAGVGTGARGNVVLNGTGSALATTATGGFTCIPTCAGTPTGTPASIPTGTVPMVFDTTNLKLYVYTGGAWKGTAAFT